MFCNLMVYIDSSKLPDSLSELSTITMIIFYHTQRQGTVFVWIAFMGGLFLSSLVEQERFTAV